MDVTEASSITYVPGDSKKLSDHVEVQYLKPYVGELYSEKNQVEFVTDQNGSVSGDLVTWTKNNVGEKYLTNNEHVRVKFPDDVKIERGDTFECLTKSPFLVNNKIKFTITIYKKTGVKEAVVYCDKAKQLKGLV